MKRKPWATAHVGQCEQDSWSAQVSSERSGSTTLIIVHYERRSHLKSDHFLVRTFKGSFVWPDLYLWKITQEAVRGVGLDAGRQVAGLAAISWEMTRAGPGQWQFVSTEGSCLSWAECCGKVLAVNLSVLLVLSFGALSSCQHICWPGWS